MCRPNTSLKDVRCVPRHPLPLAVFADHVEPDLFQGLLNEPVLLQAVYAGEGVVHLAMCHEPSVFCNAQTFQPALDCREGHTEVSATGTGAWRQASDITDVESHEREPPVPEGGREDAANAAMGLLRCRRGGQSPHGRIRNFGGVCHARTP